MRAFGTSYLESLERRNDVLFLVAGGLLVGYAALNGLAAFTDVAYPTVEDVLGPAGFAVGFLGLLGVYRVLVARPSRLASVGAFSAVLGVVGFAAITLQSLGQVTGLVAGAPPVWFSVVLLLGATGMLLGFTSCGVATLRTGVYSRTVGALLIAPTVIFVLMLAQSVLFVQFGLFSDTTMQLSAFLISSGQAIVYLSLGYSLSLSSVPTDRTVPASDVTTG